MPRLRVRLPRMIGWSASLSRLRRARFWLAGLRYRARSPRALIKGRIAPPLAFGANIAVARSGVGGVPEASRLTAKALEAAGVPVSLADACSGEARCDGRSGVIPSEGNPFRFNLLLSSIPQAEELLWRKGPAFFADHYNIAFWPWEYEVFPEKLHGLFRYYDEVWVPSRFCLDVVSSVSPVPVFCFPHPIALRESIASHSRLLMSIPADATVFLSIFHLLTHFRRKNVLGLIEAFRRAFRPNDNAWLVIKVTDSSTARERLSFLQGATKGSNIRLIDETVRRDELDDLIASCSAYVSLHRSEGFGLTIAEAMAIGKPVIATAYGGNMDYMTATNSYPVDYTLVDLEPDASGLRKGRWAEPDLDQAALLMRNIHESLHQAQSVGD